MRFTISFKLLVVVLPLVCLPMAIVGYFSVHAAAERVNRLVRHEQMVKVKASASQINDVFHSCRIDLDTLAGLPVLEDYYHALAFRLTAEAEFNHGNIVRLFKDFIGRQPFYAQIRFIDDTGRELIRVSRDGEQLERGSQAEAVFFRQAMQMGPSQFYVSPIMTEPQGYRIHWARPIFGGWRHFAGVIVIDLDHDAIIALVSTVRIGQNGYAFLVDDQGRSIAHPRYPPFALDINERSEPSLKAMVAEMVTGASEWQIYTFEGEEKVAAFAPVPEMGWSLAVAVPLAEFGQEAEAIRTRVLQVAGITLVVAMAVVALLSYLLLQPVRNLVAATRRIAAGDLRQQLPVKTGDELGDLTAAFNDMVANLARVQDELVRSEKLISLGRLSAGVAHEIRNPLNAIKGAIVHIQRRRGTDSLIAEYTRLVAEEIDRLNSFVSDFLLFARQSPPKKAPADLNQLVAGVASLFADQAAARSVALVQDLAPGLPPVALDAGQIEQVLVNLLINAMDALPGGGKVVLATALDTGPERLPAALFSVADNGIGMAESDRQNIFDPFFSTKDGGTGLGLPLGLGMVENHGGAMEVDSGPGQGTRVTVRLPLEAGATRAV